MNEKCKTVKISTIAEINKNSISNRTTINFINYLDTANITEGKINSIQTLEYGIDKIPSRAKRIVREKDIIISTVRPNQKHYGIITNLVENMIVSTGFTVLSVNREKMSPHFLYYYITQNYITQHLQSIAETSVSAYPSIRPSVIGDLEISLPPLSTQRKIAAILSSLDDKIENNRKTCEKLEEMAQAIFKQWFVEFEFPNEQGKPYKINGGKMVDSEMGMIPEGWRVGKLGDIVNIFDSKRIPLSKREREKKKGKYPYYGATSIMDYVDDYIFDGINLLMGEDGSVIDEYGYPFLQYVWGKIWVNNHAHVLTGKNPFTTEYLYILLRNTNVQSIITGAVQLKINQSNLKSVSVFLPDTELLNRYTKVLNEAFSEYRDLSEQNKRLIQIRDTLLPKLMSGELSVEDVREV